MKMLLNSHKETTMSKSEITVLDKGFELQLSESSLLKVTLVEINGTERYDIRQYYRTKTDPEWKPTPKGVMIPESFAKKFAIRFRNFVKRMTDE
jgi:hypothetical protein